MEPAWRPAARIEQLRQRAELLARVRRFFAERGVWEVDTPQLSATAIADPNIESVAAELAGRRYWLQSSPEAAMKRLLAAGSGSIYQICHAFRGGERGRLHNVEFTLLEWYQVGFDHHALMDEVVDLAAMLLGERPRERMSYREAFLRHAGIDPFALDAEGFAARAAEWDMAVPDLGADIDAWRDLFFSYRVAPALGRGRYSFVDEFPASQAALARLHRDEQGDLVAERFELFIDGIEIANGYHELTDPDEQRQRFRAEAERREIRGEPLPDLDERLLAALAAGLPDCAGVALGLDRLIMLALGAERLDEVMAFPFERA